MTVTIAYYPELPENAPNHILELPLDAVRTIVIEAMATRGYQGTAAVDDGQFGTFAYDVTASILAAAARKLASATALALAPYVWHMRRHNFGATVESNEAYGMHSEDLAAPQANWCSGNVHHTLGLIGLIGLSFDDAEGAEFPAARLLDACDGSPWDERVAKIRDIAAYAITKGGPDAVVTIA